MDVILRVEKLSKKFGARMVLKDISFSIKAGEIVGFVGPNGAGKTTVMKCCMGLLRPLRGEITVCGNSMRTQFERAVSEISYMSDSGIFYDYLSGFDNLRIYAKMYGTYDAERLNKIIRFVGMEERKKDPVKSYSLGMKQRMSLALSVLNDPKIVLMDEPMNGLDPEGVALLRKFITEQAAEKRIAFLISSHNLNELDKICSRIITIQGGELRGEFNTDSVKNTVFCLRTSDIVRSRAIIRAEFGIDAAEREEGLVFILPQEQLNKLMQKLVSSEIEIVSLKTLNLLEVEYMDLFGGERDAKSGKTN